MGFLTVPVKGKKFNETVFKWFKNNLDTSKFYFKPNVQIDNIVNVEYQEDVVEISARLGDFIGTRGKHFIAENKVPVRYDILAPNYRSVQKTWDLDSFWINTYPEIRKELRGRYPKHPWPEKIL